MQSFLMFGDTSSQRIHSRGLVVDNCVACPENITTLYRGFQDAETVMFQWPTILLGIFGRSIPYFLNIENLHQHKIVNQQSKYYFVSFSERENVACTRGEGNYIAIDPTLIRNFMVDIDKTHSLHQLSYPGRMADEFEQVCVAVPYCSVKMIYLNNKAIANPFYLSITMNDKKATNEFTIIYQNYIELLRNQYERGLTSEVVEQCKQFTSEYIQFFEKYSVNHILNYSFAKMRQQFPEYMQHFDQGNPALSGLNGMTLFNTNMTLKDIMLKMADTVLFKHVYTRDREKIAMMEHTVVQNYYEDEYARPQFD